MTKLKFILTYSAIVISIIISIAGLTGTIILLFFPPVYIWKQTICAIMIWAPYFALYFLEKKFGDI